MLFNGACIGMQFDLLCMISIDLGFSITHELMDKFYFTCFDHEFGSPIDEVIAFT